MLDFTQPYAYNPAEFAATVASGITTIDGFANQNDLRRRSDDLSAVAGGYPRTSSMRRPPAAPPAGATVFPLETDQDLRPERAVRTR